ncbi:MAG TPA: D-alanyl-D-alanine carboxypeptidase/D-alanyl-D-alanine-endopeptidase [Thermoanaerobaculia bacterium]|nr:D-alanyl-D-alanine carboxypeptidase/D-alanyl-D-alanine-endopeptidase [Thermoanaerobaculia bacterium]
MGRFPLIRRRLRACLLLPLFIVFSVSHLEAAARKKKTQPPPQRREAPSSEASSLADALALASQRPPSGPNNLSIEIVDLDTGEPVFQRNPDSPETIASVTKLFSTATALHYLGADYKFKTTFWRTGEIKDGVLQGSLLVVGGGDPNISGRFYNDDYNAVFDTWASGLKALGVTKVTGPLILNDSFFDSVTRHPDWKEGQEQKWYQAPVSALAYNDNVVLVGIRPGPKPGKPAAVSFEPSTESMRATSNAKTVGQRGKIAVGVRREAGSNAVSVSGTVPMRGVWWSTPIAVHDPIAFFGGSLKKRLRAAGIELAGGVTQKDVKPDDTWALVAQTESSLVPTLTVINKRSQGFYAEQTFKTVAAEKMGKGTWPNALSLEKQFLASLNLDPDRFDLHDGSGLSPNNKVAAGDVVRFLRAMSSSANGAVWKTTMATGGEAEGTLRHRLNDPISRGRVIAKTGSIQGVSTLAGYATGVSGKTYAFAILLNGGRVYDTNGHAYQDRLIRALIKNG